jgi:hypothetical protein
VFAVDWPGAEPMHLGAGAFDCGSYRMYADMDELRIWSARDYWTEIDAAANQPVGCSENGLVRVVRMLCSRGAKLIQIIQLQTRSLGLREQSRV